MLRIHQIKCGLDEHLDQKMVARKLGCPADAVRSYAIERESLDARRDSCRGPCAADGTASSSPSHR